MSVDFVNGAHLYARVDASFLVPNIIARIVEVPEYLENLRHLQYITFGGSPLLCQIGNKVRDFAYLFLSFGTTECGHYALEETDPEAWEYTSFSPIIGYKPRPFLNDLYKFFFVRNDDGQKS